MKKRLSLQARIDDLRKQIAMLNQFEAAIGHLPMPQRRTRTGLLAALHVMEDAQRKGITNYCKEGNDYEPDTTVPSDLHGRTDPLHRM